MTILSSTKINSLRSLVTSSLLDYDYENSRYETEVRIQGMVRKHLKKWSKDKNFWIIVEDQKLYVELGAVQFSIVQNDPLEWILSLGSIHVFSGKSRR